MDKHLDELFIVSREWTTFKRTSEVGRAATVFLREHFEIEAGFVNYERVPRIEGDYLREPLRWFTQWGYPGEDEELRHAIAQSTEFESRLRTQNWFDANDVPAAWADINEEIGIQQVGLWLIEFDNRPVGLFALAKRSVDENELTVISRCMAHIIVIIEMLIARRFAEEMSIRDPLTGLLNRRGFLKEFERITDSPEGPLTIGVLDIDNFKCINDESGHLVGDKVLLAVGDVLTEHAKQYRGVCARIGGDEFMILAHIGVRDVYRAASTVAGWFEAAGISASVSVGCAVIGPDGDTFDLSYHEADKRLYELKEKKAAYGSSKSPVSYTYDG